MPDWLLLSSIVLSGLIGLLGILVYRRLRPAYGAGFRRLHEAMRVRAERESPVVFVSALDASADLRIADVLSELRRFRPDVRLVGIGGSQMKDDARVEVLKDYTEFAANGFGAVLVDLAVWAVRLFQAAALIDKLNPNLVVLVAGAAFNGRLLKHAWKRGIPSIFVFVPDTWVYWPGTFLRWIRGDRNLAYASELVVLSKIDYAFYKDYLEKTGIPRDRLHFAGTVVRRVCHVVPKLKRRDGVHVGLLPGIRRLEVETLLPLLLRSTVLVKKKHAALEKVVVPLTGPFQKDTIEKIVRRSPKDGVTVRVVSLEERYEALAECDLVMAKAGSATVEAICVHTPIITVHVLPWPERIAEVLGMFHKPPYTSWPNVVLGREVYPELRGRQVRAESVARTAVAMLENPARLHDLRQLCKNIADGELRIENIRTAAEVIHDLLLQVHPVRARS